MNREKEISTPDTSHDSDGGTSVLVPSLMQMMGCPWSWEHYPDLRGVVFVDEFPCPEDRFSCFLCQLVFMHSPFFEMFLEMGQRLCDS